MEQLTHCGAHLWPSTSRSAPLQRHPYSKLLRPFMVTLPDHLFGGRGREHDWNSLGVFQDSSFVPKAFDPLSLDLAADSRYLPMLQTPCRLSLDTPKAAMLLLSDRKMAHSDSSITHVPVKSLTHPDRKSSSHTLVELKCSWNLLFGAIWHCFQSMFVSIEPLELSPIRPRSCHVLDLDCVFAASVTQPYIQTSIPSETEYDSKIPLIGPPRTLHNRLTV